MARYKKSKVKASTSLSAAIIAILLFVGVGIMGDSEPDNSEKDNSQIVVSTETESELISDSSTVKDSEKDLNSNSESNNSDKNLNATVKIPVSQDEIAKIPEYSGSMYVPLNDNVPFFGTTNLGTKSFEYYSDLDSQGRCGVVYACVGKDIMPTADREGIGQVKPTGWHTVKYDCVDGKYLYNRCHLIGFQLSGENANNKNLITGTRQMNVDGMLPFENMVADYVKETGNHVMYRVTPVFDGKNLLADGVIMEGYSVEDKGEGVCFNVFVYNVQDNIGLDYSTGDSWFIEKEEIEEVVVVPTPTPEPEPEPEPEPDHTVSTGRYAVNAKNGKIHMVGECSATGDGQNAMTDAVYFDTYEEALAYSKRIAPGLEKRDCGNCW